MPHYLLQASYTPEAVARMVANPQDRTEAVRAPVEKLGGRLNSLFLAFGESDVVCIIEMPNNVQAAAIALALAAGAAVRNVKTTPLMTTAEGVEALKKASTTGYKSVIGGSASAAGQR